MTNIEKILSDLIAIRTDALGRSNKECVDYICRILSENGILFRRVAHAGGQCESVIAGVNVQELKNIKTGLVLSGHMDTVGVNPKDWDTNPFVATSLNGRIYGRGTVDMKYFIAVVLSVLSELKEVGYPIFLLFSADEETEVEGIRVLTSFLQMRNICPKYALVGEPTNFEVCVSSKGYCGYTTVVKGVSAHSSRPDLGVNAIYAVAQIVSEIEKYNMQYMASDTTLNVGIISGGVQRNSIPSEASFDWEIRFSEEKHKNEISNKIQQLQSKLSQTYGHLYVRTEVRENLPAFERIEKSKAVEIAQSILNTDVLTLPVATEAGFLQKIGIDTIVCGAGDVKLAHTSSENIKVTDLERYKEFLLKYVKAIESDMSK